MTLDTATRDRIDQLLGSHRLVLFMKGSPQAPQRLPPGCSRAKPAMKGPAVGAGQRA